MDGCARMDDYRQPYLARRASSSMVRKIEKVFEKSNLSPLGIRLLTFLARHPSDEFYTKELANDVGASVSGCHTALAGLQKDRLVVRRKDGVNVYWRADTDNPALVSFKVFMNIQELGGVIDRLKDISVKVVLFGSCATGEDTGRSDIDLLVVTNEIDEVSHRLSGILVNGRSISPIVLTPARLLGVKEEDRALYDEMRKGIVLWVGVHE